MPGSASSTRQRWARGQFFAYKWASPGTVKDPQWRIDDVQEDGTVKRSTFQYPVSNMALTGGGDKLKPGAVRRLPHSVFWIGVLETTPGLFEIDLFDYEVGTLIERAKHNDGFLRRWIE